MDFQTFPKRYKVTLVTFVCITLCRETVQISKKDVLILVRRCLLFNFVFLVSLWPTFTFHSLSLLDDFYLMGFRISKWFKTSHLVQIEPLFYLSCSLLILIATVTTDGGVLLSIGNPKVDKNDKYEVWLFSSLSIILAWKSNSVGKIPHLSSPAKSHND